MKGYIVILLLIASTAIGTYLFQQRQSSTPDLMDNLAIGLDSIAQVLPQSAFIYYDTQNINHDIFTRARYLLAPRNLVISKRATIDTLLSIVDINYYKSNNYTTLTKVLIDKKEGQYHYILSTSK